MKKIKYKHELTFAYAAGRLTAKLYNTYYTRKDLPSVILCLRDFKHLRTIFGKYYNLLRQNKVAYPAIIHYEQFDKLHLKDNQIGELTDFFIGYSDYIKKDKI